MNYLQYFSTKKLGSYADIRMYSSTSVSLKMLIYSEIYIKPLKTCLFTLLKMESLVSFATTCRAHSYPPTLCPSLGRDGAHRTKTYCLNKLCPNKVEC